MKCIHEWRIFGTRMEESVSTPIRTANAIPEASITCTKCGIDQHAVGYEVIERRPRPDYDEKSWLMCTKDVIVKVKSFGTHTHTILGCDKKTNELYDKEIYKWDNTEEQWIKQ